MLCEKSMIKRNGAAIRNLLIAVTLVSLMYFVYMHHDTQTRLHHSEIVSEKFKRDRESLSAQLNEINLEKTNLKEKYYKDRQELSGRFAEAQQKHKMLQSQHQDLENEYNRLQQKFEKYSEDNKQKDMNRNQEYMQLKQEKEMEIVKLKDENANIMREYKQLKLELAELKKQVEQQQKNAAIAAGVKADGIGGAAAGAAAGAPAAVDGGVAGGVAAGAGVADALNSNQVLGMNKPDAFENKLNQNNIEQPLQGNNIGHADIIPKQPVGLRNEQNLQIQPAQPAYGDKLHPDADLDHDKDAEVNNLALQKQEILNRQHEGANDHNQVQPPINDKHDKQNNNTLGSVKAANASVNLVPAANNNNNNNNNEQNVLIPPNQGVIGGSNKTQNVAPALPADSVHESNKENPVVEGVKSNSLKDINSNNKSDNNNNNAHHVIL